VVKMSSLAWIHHDIADRHCVVGGIEVVDSQAGVICR